MANELKIYYSSGSKVATEFDGQPRKSVGGIITPTKVPQNLNALFGKVSLKALSQGSEDYRMVFLKNDGVAAIAAVASTGSITISNNSLIGGDTITINGVALVEGVDFTQGATAADTAISLKGAIDANVTLNILITVAIVGNVLNITAITEGVVGDSITLLYTDSGSGVAVALSGANLSGGIDAVVAADITDLKLYLDLPVTATVDDPSLLVPAPVVGDKWIVPTTAVGDWFVPDADDATINTAVGKKAVYDGVNWIFSFAPFSDFEFGFVAPIDVVLYNQGKATTLQGSYVEPIENVFEQPSGIEFVGADTLANEILIGDLSVDSSIGMWVKRKIDLFRIQSFDLIKDEGGIVLDEVIPFVFTYDTP